MTISDLPPLLREAITARGYDTLTAVQSSVAAPEAQDRDLIVSAQTGSGKTVAFGIAMASLLLEDGRLQRGGAPLGLVIAPTRELALQVSRELQWLYEKAGASVVTCVGGMDPAQEGRALRRGAHIVVGTPGRLRDHLERGRLDLKQLRVAVLDEADEMLDMGFREDLEEILDATPDGRRTFLFSATMPRPIVALAKRYQQDALRISTVGEDRGHGDIDYRCVTVSPADIENAVVNILRYHEADTAMLFCATRENVRRLHAILSERGFDAVAISGEHSQSERNRAMQALRDRRARVCVATDVAARGIDLPSLSLVVHVELPRDAEVLQHRSGRTGRAGRKGTAILVVPYPRRKRVMSMLRGAKIEAEWSDPPSMEDIARQDRERLMDKLVEPIEASDADKQMAATLLEKKSAEEIAIALIHAHRAKMPAPEEMLGGAKGEQQHREIEQKKREGFEKSSWFKLNIGRRQNADPRWLLPLLCRRGHVTKDQIGAIRISDDESFVQIAQSAVDKFAESVRRTAGADGEDDGGVLIQPAPDGAAPAHRPARKQISPRGPGGFQGRGGPRGPGGPGGPGGKPRFGGPKGPRKGPGGNWKARKKPRD